MFVFLSFHLGDSQEQLAPPPPRSTHIYREMCRIQAEMELGVAKPALMAAHEAVNCLDKGSLTELKSFSKVSGASTVHAAERCISVNSVPMCCLFGECPPPNVTNNKPRMVGRALMSEYVPIGANSNEAHKMTSFTTRFRVY